MNSKSELLKQLGWSDEQLTHFMIDDRDDTPQNTVDEVEIFESVSTDNHTISFKFGIADKTKISIKN